MPKTVGFRQKLEIPSFILYPETVNFTINRSEIFVKIYIFFVKTAYFLFLYIFFIQYNRFFSVCQLPSAKAFSRLLVFVFQRSAHSRNAPHIL